MRILRVWLVVVITGSAAARAGDTPKRLETIRLAGEHAQQGNYEAAQTMLIHTLNLVRSEGAHLSLEATILNNLGNIANELGQFKEAEKYYQRSISILESVGPKAREALSRPLNNLAVSYTHMGRYAEAERLFSRSLAVRTEIKGPRHTDLVPVLSSLCSAQRAMARFKSAEEQCRRAIAILEGAGDELCPMLPQTYLNLALVYLDQDDLFTATQWVERALTIAERAPSIRESALLQILMTATDVRLKLGLLQEAAETLQRAESIAQSHLTGEHPLRAGILFLQARALRSANRRGEARKLEERAARILSSHQRENLIEHSIDVSSLRSIPK